MPSYIIRKEKYQNKTYNNQRKNTCSCATALGTNNTSPTTTTKRAAKSTTKKLKTEEGATWRYWNNDP